MLFRQSTVVHDCGRDAEVAKRLQNRHEDSRHCDDAVVDGRERTQDDDRADPTDELHGPFGCAGPDDAQADGPIERDEIGLGESPREVCVVGARASGLRLNCSRVDEPVVEDPTPSPDSNCKEMALH